jgi:uncharacterized protein (TIGR02001 family)
MKSYGLAAVFAATVLGSGAYAADLGTQAPPAPAPAPASTEGFDYAFGGKLMSDYISRGITQTDHAPSGTAYGELRYNIGNTQLYTGIQPWIVKLPTGTPAEIDLYGGVRETIGPVTVDVGAIYYEYPDNTNQYWVNTGAPAATQTFLNPTLAQLPLASRCPTGPWCATTAANPSYLEIYAKPTWTVNDSLTLGGNLYYSPNWDNYNFDETYVSGTAKYAFGTSGFSVSGELGREILGSLKAGTIFNATGSPSFPFVSYTTWNAGVSYAWKVFTLDVRYYDTTLNRNQCYIDSSDPHGNVPGLAASGTSNWCGSRVMATLSFDLTSANLK